MVVARKCGDRLYFLQQDLFAATRKNRVRIGMMDEAAIRPWSFFDKKSYLIMAFMMTFGILLRKSALLPTLFFAVFYTGLGAALFAAGVKYFCQLFARGGVCDAQGDLL